MGDKRARNDKATAQTRNRCHIFGGLCHRRRSRRNGNIDSSQTRTDPAVTMVRGAPTLAGLVLATQIATQFPRSRSGVCLVGAQFV